MPFNLKAVLFDLDGVLVHSPLDLPAIKRELFGQEPVIGTWVRLGDRLVWDPARRTLTESGTGR